MLDTCVSGSVVVGSIFFFDRLAGKSNLVGASQKKPRPKAPLPIRRHFLSHCSHGAEEKQEDQNIEGR